MRDQFLLRPFGGLSIRNFLLFFATLIVATFAYLFAAPTAHAATDITWKDGNIVYGGDTYFRKDDIKAGSTTGLPEGTKIFTFFNPPEAGPNEQQKAQIIYFSKDTDPATAESANFVIYDVVSNGDPIIYANPTSKKTVSATPQSGAQRDSEATSCDVEGGLGWIICPLTNTLSFAMDKIFGFLIQFLEVQPMSTDQESSMFRAWSMMRNFANICFVIGFLIVIYSQLSNLGLSNYGIKKMLPRLVIAAVLVNVSYWICAVGVDLSNIAGHSIGGIFEAMRNNLTGTGENDHDVWSNLSGSILAGSTFAIATGVGVHTFATAAGGAVYMLLPILLGVMLTALVALIIMAARQALITIMIIIAPLAFVAYLLPNTEKHFKKWHELFTTMLMVFPAFAVVFGGSQLAGDVIIQNANSIIIVILGLAVKIAPIAITPLLMKVSGSLLGKVAGVVNNPRKGILDRTRNMAQERADAHTSRALAGNKAGFLGINKAARSIDSSKRKREGWKKAHDGRADANWAGSDEFGRIHHYDANSHQLKEIGENAAARHTAIMQATNAADQNLDLRARASKIDLDVSKARVETNWDEIKAGDSTNIISPAGLSISALRRYKDEHAAYAQNATLESAVEARRAASAQSIQKDNITEAYLSSANLQKRAGGIAGQLGADDALADAIKGKRASHAEAVADASELLTYFNPQGKDRQALAKTERDIIVTHPLTGQQQTFSKDNKFVVEAALNAQLSGQGSYEDIRDIMLLSGKDASAGGLKQYASVIGDAIPKYKLAEKAAFLSGATIDEVKQGKIDSEGALDKAILRNITAGKLKAEHLATNDVLAVKNIIKVANDNRGSTDADTIREIAQLSKAAKEALTNTSLRGRSASNVREELEKLVQQYPPPPPPANP
jgi:hypothetical protein